MESVRPRSRIAPAGEAGKRIAPGASPKGGGVPVLDRGRPQWIDKSVHLEKGCRGVFPQGLDIFWIKVSASAGSNCPPLHRSISLTASSVVNPLR